jgi:hypothetical protein
MYNDGGTYQVLRQQPDGKCYVANYLNQSLSNELLSLSAGFHGYAYINSLAILI